MCMLIFWDFVKRLEGFDFLVRFFSSSWGWRVYFNRYLLMLAIIGLILKGIRGDRNRWFDIC